MGAYPKSKEVQSKTRAKKTQKPGIRYFNETGQDRDVRKVNLSSREFTGEVIEVDQKKQQKNTKFNFKSKNVKKLIKNQKKPKKIPEELLKKYKRGEKVENTGVKTNFFKEKQQRKEVYLEYAVEQAARTEILLPEQQGFIVPDSEEITSKYRQDEIVQNVDIQSAAKYFKLNLEFGPYSLRYTKNGRHLLLGGRRGHVAAFDWVTKKLLCEINVMEEVADVSWLHVHTMFACAQKNWVYIYDSQGTELHCIKRLHRINRMEFLPYHFLLAAGSGNGYVSWLDVSIGELVGNFNTHLGEIRLMHQNPSNGVLCIGGGKGVVTMWSPKVREPLAKMLCHSTPMSGLTVDPKGVHMVTSGLDRLIKVWDIRSLNGPMAQYSLRLPANQIEVSQRGVLAFTQGNYCELYTNLLLGNGSESPYLRQSCAGFISDMSFCPYEDILGIATTKGFQSLLVPGSGEPNYDALEDNPFQTSKQRREHEVHALLEKVPPELITLDASDISGVDVPTLQEKVDAKLSLFYVKPPEIDFKSRRKMKGRGGSVKAARNRQIVKDLNRKEFFGELRKTKENIINEHKIKDDDNFIPLVTDTKPSVLDRFNSKNKRK